LALNRNNAVGIKKGILNRKGAEAQRRTNLKGEYKTAFSIIISLRLCAFAVQNKIFLDALGVSAVH
jgi:hypothetical protein